MSSAAFVPAAAGTARDLEQSTDLADEIAFFGSLEEARLFATTAFRDVVGRMTSPLRYADFGGGQGVLARAVADLLHEAGMSVDALVIDANEGYLRAARARGLGTLLANIQNSDVSGLDLATMRLVNHYNGETQQLPLIRAVHASLKPGGFFASQIETGSDAVCSLYTEIANLPSLNGDLVPGYYWIGERRYSDLMANAGFGELAAQEATPDVVMTIDHALSIAWNRFNGRQFAQAVKAEDTDRLGHLAQRRRSFLEQARHAAERAVATGRAVDPELQAGRIRLRYPIIVGRR